MGLLDFTEIAPAHIPSLSEDDFEIFACRFLRLYGYTIISEPSHGVDGGKDMVVKDTLSTAPDSELRTHIVSCKHLAHANGGKGKIVGKKVEQDFLERVAEHNVDGFIGFYSTEISSGLANRLDSVGKNSNFHCHTGYFTPQKINKIVSNNFPQYRNLLIEFFPESIKKHEDLKYRNLPQGSSDEHFIKDHPDLIIRNTVSDGGTFALLNLKEGSEEIGKTVLTIDLPMEEDPESRKILDAIGAGEEVEIPGDRVTYNSDVSIGKLLGMRADRSVNLRLSPVTTRNDIDAEIRFRSNSTSRASIAIQQPFSLYNHTSGRFRLCTPLPHEDSAFYVDVRNNRSSNRDDVGLTMNLGIGGKSPRVADQILQARSITASGAAVSIFDRTNSRLFGRWTVQKDVISHPQENLIKAIRQLCEIEEILETVFTIPEVGLTSNDMHQIDRNHQLLETGRADISNSVLDVRFDSPPNIKDIDLKIPMTVYWRNKAPIDIQLLDRSLTFNRVLWQVLEGQVEPLDVKDEESNENGAHIRITVKAPQTMTVVVLDFVEDLEHWESLYNSLEPDSFTLRPSTDL